MGFVITEIFGDEKQTRFIYIFSQKFLHQSLDPCDLGPILPESQEVLFRGLLQFCIAQKLKCLPSHLAFLGFYPKARNHNVSRDFSPQRGMSLEYKASGPPRTQKSMCMCMCTQVFSGGAKISVSIKEKMMIHLPYVNNILG